MRLSERAEKRAFMLIVAVVASWILIDEVVLLEPGVARLDHLGAAAVPVFVLLLLAWRYPRARAGERATANLMIGLHTVVGGLVAYAETATAGWWSAAAVGLALVPAGMTMIILGALLLWQSRRQGRLRYPRRGLWALGGLLLAFYVIEPTSFAYVATHRPAKTAAAVAPDLTLEEISLSTRDGLTLAARYSFSHNGAAIIVYPGESALRHARMLAARGYGVLALDPRGYGDSEGDPNAWGWGCSADIDAAVAFLKGRADVEDGRIGGLGISVGGEQMLEAAARNPYLAAVVSEGAGLRSARESSAREGLGTLRLVLQFPQDAVLTAATAIMSGDAPPPSLLELTPRISPRAAFFIYGEHGQAIERALTPPYFDAAAEPKELWEVPAAGHTEGLAAQPKDYEQRVVGFFDKALPGH